MKLDDSSPYFSNSKTKTEVFASREGYFFPNKKFFPPKDIDFTRSEKKSVKQPNQQSLNEKNNSGMY